MSKPSVPQGEEQPAVAAIPLSTVGEEFAAMADFLRQRLLARAHQVDGLNAHVARLEAAVGEQHVRLDDLANQIQHPGE